MPRYLAIIDVLNVLDPGVDNSLPGVVGRPDNSLPSGGSVDNTLPTPPAGVTPPAFPTNPVAPGAQVPVLPDNTLPPGDGGVYVLAYVPALGWRYVKVDLGLRPDNELPSGPPDTPSNELPETPEPK